MEYIDVWKLKNWQRNLLHKLFSIIYRKPIQVGDKIKCFGVGYPHWKNHIFECTFVFNDGCIGIKNCIKVSSKDFRVI